MNENDLLKNIEIIESHIRTFSRRTRELLFDDNYKGLDLYLSKKADSIKTDVDNIRDFSHKLQEMQLTKAEPKQLDLPF